MFALPVLSKCGASECSGGVASCSRKMIQALFFYASFASGMQSYKSIDDLSSVAWHVKLGRVYQVLCVQHSEVVPVLGTQGAQQMCH
eukprot:756651-Hanusia_phi.AAC.1